MNFDLLSQNLLLVLSGIVTTVLAYLLGQILWPVKPAVIKKGRPKKQTDKRPVHELKQMELFLLVGGSIIAATVLKIAIAHYTDSPLPSGFIFMVFPSTLSVGLVLLAVRLATRLWSLAIVSLVLCVLFSLFLINNYYRFYPTLGEVFNQNGALALSDAQTKVLVRYSAPNRNTSTDQQSLEKAINSLPNQSTNGKVYSLNIPGTVSNFNTRTAYVYIPAIYNSDPNIRLPVMVLMPGFPGLPENWLGSGLQTTMDEFAKQHDGITPLVFMVDNTGSLTNDTECVDSPRGNAETYLTVDVPNYIKNHFDVETDSSHWAIGGLSLGGTCAIMLALRHPDVYHYFIDLGGEIGPEIGSQQHTIDTLFGGSQTAWQAHQPEYLLATRSYKNLGMGGFFGDGKQDTLNVTSAAEQLSYDAQRAGIETVYDTINGQHTFNVWQQTFKLALPWASNRIGATECRANCP